MHRINSNRTIKLFETRYYGLKPFLKWAGGKTQLLAQFDNYYPQELKLGKIKYYYEPFIGGGAVFFDIIQKYHIEYSFLFDINAELILVYNVLKDHPDDLIDELDRLQMRYNRLDKDERANFYYRIREEYNNNLDENHIYNNKKIRVNRAVQMIFLNKTCFNGLYRVNRKGKFNVPFGDYENPKFYDEENFKNISNVLHNCEITTGDFEQLKSVIKEESFVYFDPPYRPISKTSSFKSYSENEFGDDRQKKLSEIYKELDKRGMKLMLSNSDPKNYDSKDDFFEELYKGYNIYRIPANRMINCNGGKRGKINELLILNYEYENKFRKMNNILCSEQKILNT